jgi:hypothetical protein
VGGRLFIEHLDARNKSILICGDEMIGAVDRGISRPQPAGVE